MTLLLDCGGFGARRPAADTFITRFCVHLLSRLGTVSPRSNTIVCPHWKIALKVSCSLYQMFGRVSPRPASGKRSSNHIYDWLMTRKLKLRHRKLIFNHFKVFLAIRVDIELFTVSFFVLFSVALFSIFPISWPSLVFQFYVFVRDFGSTIRRRLIWFIYGAFASFAYCLAVSAIPRLFVV